MLAKRLRQVGLAALLFSLAAALALALVRPPSPLAAADRLFERAAFFYLAPPRPQSPDIVLIAITEETLSLFPYRSPIDRAFLARTVDELAAAGARAIGIDILFDQPTEAAKDAALRQALARAAAPVVTIAVAPETSLAAEQQRFLDDFLAGRRMGYANLARERFDDIVREHVPRHPATGGPSFPAALAAAVDVAVPERPFAIDWHSRPAPAVPPFAIYPAETVPSLPRAWLQGKIALIGTLLPGQDEHRTLVSAFGLPTHGVEIHAHVLSQILEGRVSAPPVVAWRTAATLVFTAAGMAVAALLGGWAMAAGLIGLAVLLWAGALAGFAAGGPLVPCLAPMLGLAFGGGGVRFWRGRRDQRDRQTLRHLFARFVSEPVVAEIWKERETFLAGARPRPHELTATVLFSDIAGFTPICEGLEPAPLVAWLDRYIDAMVQVVLAHDGVVLRFIGDGILAVFGAPIPRSSEAEITRDASNAVRCALAMQEAMQRLNEDWRAAGLPVAGLRVGIHSGPLVAGSLGNGPHMEYCLLGDTANTAARIEALGKQHARGGAEDCVILIGEPTWLRLGEGFRGEPVGEAALKGKQRRVVVYRIEPGRADAGFLRSG